MIRKLISILLVLPYVVTVSTDINGRKYELVVINPIEQKPTRSSSNINFYSTGHMGEGLTFNCHEGFSVNCDFLYDLAYALNKAHEDRLTTCIGSAVKNPDGSCKQ